MNEEQFVKDWDKALKSGGGESLAIKYGMSRQGIHYWASKLRKKGVNLPPMPRSFKQNPKLAKEANIKGNKIRWNNG